MTSRPGKLTFRGCILLALLTCLGIYGLYRLLIWYGVAFAFSI